MSSLKRHERLTEKLGLWRLYSRRLLRWIHVGQSPSVRHVAARGTQHVAHCSTRRATLNAEIRGCHRTPTNGPTIFCLYIELWIRLKSLCVVRTIFGVDSQHAFRNRGRNYVRLLAVMYPADVSHNGNSRKPWSDVILCSYDLITTGAGETRS